MNTIPPVTGGCDCGAVRFEVTGPLRDVIVCHCGQCQRTHGAPAPYSNVLKEDLHLIEDRGLSWYASSDFARRGFCRECGASLFWDGHHDTHISIAAGMLTSPTGVRVIGHIFMDDKGDWYAVEDGLPQFPGSSGGKLKGDTA